LQRPVLALLRLTPNHRFPSAFELKADPFGVYVCYEGHSGTDLRTPFPSGFDPQRTITHEKATSKDYSKFVLVLSLKPVLQHFAFRVSLSNPRSQGDGL